MGEESGEVSERVKGLYRKDSLKIINLKTGSVALYFRENYTGDGGGQHSPGKQRRKCSFQKGEK